MRSTCSRGASVSIRKIREVVTARRRRRTRRSAGGRPRRAGRRRPAGAHVDAVNHAPILATRAPRESLLPLPSRGEGGYTNNTSSDGTASFRFVYASVVPRRAMWISRPPAASVVIVHVLPVALRALAMLLRAVEVEDVRLAGRVVVEVGVIADGVRWSRRSCCVKLIAGERVAAAERANFRPVLFES